MKIKKGNVKDRDRGRQLSRILEVFKILIESGTWLTIRMIHSRMHKEHHRSYASECIHCRRTRRDIIILSRVFPVDLEVERVDSTYKLFHYRLSRTWSKRFLS